MGSQKIQYPRCAAFPGVCGALSLDFFPLPSFFLCHPFSFAILDPGPTFYESINIMFPYHFQTLIQSRG
jgi:hypothetical protein